MIYIHIPYCHGKCSYCAFYSVATLKGTQPYVDALCRESFVRRREMAHPVRTVYFGGGTPSMLSVEQLRMVIDALRENYDLTHIEEVTLEANPEDLSADFLERLRDLRFFNRLSVGVQSFDDGDLRLMRRRHSARQAEDALLCARQFGFDNVSVDLIYGLPSMTSEKWRSNLERISVLDPDRAFLRHLSCYALTIERGTILERQIKLGAVAAADEEATLEQYRTLKQWAEENGYAQYEVSNFCQPSFQSRHNSRYWDRTPYLGLGAAAHSFDGRARRWNVSDIKGYIEGVNDGKKYCETELLSQRDACNEYLMTALRTTAGIEKGLIPDCCAAAVGRKMARFVSLGLIEDTPTHFRPTYEGLLQADGIAAELFV